MVQAVAQRYDSNMTPVTIEQALQVALAHHQAGRLGQAEAIYRQILAHGHKEADNLSPTIALYLYGRSFFLDDKPTVLTTLQESQIVTTDVRELIDLTTELSRRLSSETEKTTALLEIVKNVHLTSGSVRVRLNIPLPKNGDDAEHKSFGVTRLLPMRMKRRGVELRLVVEGRNEMPRGAVPTLLGAVARAKRWFHQISSGQVRSSAEIARREGLQKGYVARLTRLAFISPTVVEMLAEGRTPAALNLQTLMARRLTLPPTWRDQERLLMIAQSSGR